ncbi:hypothetical protein JTE90_013504 [Oedothorax gibbosus]|uniref:Origin recognition complex subunit 1 n=1 Tax=Oedothorax gibbosus TaxID=931172 RepID=A0AAV6VPD0_9ARAC|nr:hypothetical protein JTE90_013504 [Oedothorax gibbosus]
MRLLISQDQDREFRWEGEESAVRERRRVYYKSFFLDEEKFCIGDFALIRNDDSIDPEDISNCYVGQIKELYDTGDKYEPHQARVQWYSRITELPPYTRKYFNQVHTREVIEENRPHFSDTIDADTIFGKCEVHFLPLGVDFPSFEAVLEACDVPSFFCRYRFSGVKLSPKVEEGNSGQNTPKTDKNANSERRSTRKHTNTPATPKNGTYVAMTTGTDEFPKVLIKRLDDKLLESQNQNVRIIVAKPDVISVDDITNSIKNNLNLQSPAKNRDKRPIIHSFCAAVPESPKIDVLANIRSSPRKKNTNSDILIQEVPIESKVSPTKVSNQKTPSKRKQQTSRVSSASRSRSCTPKKPFRIENGTIITPKRALKIGNGAVTPSSRSSARLQDIPKIIKTVLNTPRSSRKNTPRRVAEIKNELAASPKPVRSPARGRIADLKQETGIKEAPETPSPNKRKMTPSRLASPSPSKTPKTARRSINFSADDQGVTVTRSGRKTKPVNYFEQEDFDNKGSSRSLFTVKKEKLSKFIRINYSDDSGSEFSAAEESSSSENEGSDSDGSLVEKKSRTPRSTKKRGAETPKQKKVDLCIPDRKTPLKVAENLLEESRLRLHVAAVPKSLPCRAEEYSDIYTFVKGCLNAHTGGCMYISGVPGTGKTATVHEVVRNLECEKENGDIPLFTFVEVNGMWMTDPYQCYVQIFKSLTGKTIASQQAANLLEKRFTESGPKKESVILLVDELDRLWTRKQTVMYNIFDWPSKKHSKLIVLAIANTMDLPERLMMNRISSRLGLTRKTFQPYTFRQLQEIIMSRIQELQVFDPDAVQFVARKVAAVSGDARRALDICRHATEVAEASTQSTPKKKRKILVTMEHVDVAIQQMFSSPVIAAIKSSSKVAKLFLQGMLWEFTRTGLEETTLWKVSSRISSYCEEGIKKPSSAEISNVCSQLAAAHLILVDNFRNDIYMKIRLSVSPDDVSYALTGKEL